MLQFAIQMNLKHGGKWMKKTLSALFCITFLSTNVLAGQCEDAFKFHFTFYGGVKKDYVVTKNTFKKIKVNFPSSKLKGATAEIDLMSLDTSADMNNGKAKWPAAMAKLRNMNTINTLFKSFSTDKTKTWAKIVSVSGNSANVEIKMNGVTKTIKMTSKEKGGSMLYEGVLDILKFNTSKGWKAFAAKCRGFHKGKSWSDIKLYFSIPKACV